MDNIGDVSGVSRRVDGEELEVGEEPGGEQSLDVDVHVRCWGG